MKPDVGSERSRDIGSVVLVCPDKPGHARSSLAAGCDETVCGKQDRCDLAELFRGENPIDHPTLGQLRPARVRVRFADDITEDGTRSTLARAFPSLPLEATMSSNGSRHLFSGFFPDCPPLPPRVGRVGYFEFPLRVRTGPRCRAIHFATRLFASGSYREIAP